MTWQNLDGEVVALDLESAAYLMANHSGSHLWPLLAEGATESQLCAELTSRFPIEPERARADVGAFVDQLREMDLLG